MSTTLNNLVVSNNISTPNATIDNQGNINTQGTLNTQGIANLNIGAYIPKVSFGDYKNYFIEHHPLYHTINNFPNNGLTVNNPIYVSGVVPQFRSTSNIIQISPNQITPVPTTDLDLNTNQSNYSFVTLMDTAAWYNNTQNPSRVLMNQPFTVPLSIDVVTDGSGKTVTINVPQIEFSLTTSQVLSTQQYQTSPNQFVDASGNPTAQYYGGGFVYTVPGSNLPQNIWPQTLLGVSSSVVSDNADNTYIWTICNDGSLTLSNGTGDKYTTPFAIYDSPRVIPTVSISYHIINKLEKSPYNMRLSNGLSNVLLNILTDSPPGFEGTGFGDYCTCRTQLDDSGNVFSAWVWLDNSVNNYYQILYTRTSVTNKNTGVTKYGPVVPVYNQNIPDPSGNVATFVYIFCSTINIDPTNYKHLVVCTGKTAINTLFTSFPGTILLVFESWDAGITWSQPIYPLNDLYPFNYNKVQSGSDPNTTIDSFGNVYSIGQIVDYTQPTLNNPFSIYQHITVINSPSNGGTTSFIQLPNNGIVPPGNTSIGNYNDNLTINCCPFGDGTNAVALWLTSNQVAYNQNTITAFVGFYKVTGKIGVDGEGNPTNISEFYYIRSFGSNSVPDPSTFQIFGTDVRPSVDPSGGFYLYTSNNNNEYTSLPGNPLCDGTKDLLYYCSSAQRCITNNSSIIDSNGVAYDASNNLYFGPGFKLINRCTAFGPEIDLTFNNMGDGAGAGYHGVKWTTGRGTAGSSSTGIGVDVTRNRLYVAGLTNRPALSGQHTIQLSWTSLSDVQANNELTWSVPQVINTIASEVGLLSLSVEPTSGYVTIGWYDPGNSVDGTSVDRYGTVFLPA
jgi:hypothetical protein